VPLIFFILFKTFLKVLLRPVVEISRYLLPRLHGGVELPRGSQILLVLPLQIKLDFFLFQFHVIYQPLFVEFSVLSVLVGFYHFLAFFFFLLQSFLLQVFVRSVHGLLNA
jgi:hypothetical protein